MHYKIQSVICYYSKYFIQLNLFFANNNFDYMNFQFLDFFFSNNFNLQANLRKFTDSANVFKHFNNDSNEHYYLFN